MESHIGYIMTVSNSIIGVSILAMPFCFKQCGIILAILMLLASSFISRLTCHYLLKSANMARRRTFELLAFHTFGSMGKLIVELGIIGFLMGTCIAFFVIIGDLGPTIIAKILELNNTDTLRTSLLVCMAAFCVLPLGLLKNVESLSSVSTATIGFYFCLVLKTISESAGHVGIGDWMSKVELWRPAGILQCFPIFSMALSCQTQLFEIYDTLPNASLEKMNYVVRMAVNICVCVYICVGFFGYIAFASGPFTGNILMSFSPSIMTDAMKIGFVLSVACSFPLVIFPCRASLYSLLFRKFIPPKYTYAYKLFVQNTQTELDDTDEQNNEGYSPYEGISNFIPETRFKLLTFFIVGVSLIIGIMIPNIEVVLGLVGSTIGTLICVIFPVTCFICISTKNTNERILAQIMLFIGVIMMVMGTYANLYAMEESHTEVVLPKDAVKINQNFIKNNKDNIIDNINKPLAIIKEPANFPPDIKIPSVEKIEVRHEPPQPEEPVDNIIPKIELPAQKNVKDPEKNEPLNSDKNKQQKNDPLQNEQQKAKKIDHQPNDPNKIDSQKQSIVESPIKVDVPPTLPSKAEQKSETIKPVEIDQAAIQKEFLEELEDKNKNEDLIEDLKKTQEEQHKMILVQKKLIEQIEKQKQELKIKEIQGEKENEKKIQAVSQLVEIAKKTLESLGKNANVNNEVNKEIVNVRNDLKNSVNIVGASNNENEINVKNKKIEIEGDTNKNTIEGGGDKVDEINKKDQINGLSIGDKKNKEIIVQNDINQDVKNIENIKKGNEVKKTVKENEMNDVNKKNLVKNDIKSENIEKNLKKINSTIENMLPFPLKILNLSNNKKELVMKKENKSGILKEKEGVKPDLKNEKTLMENQIETKINEKKEEIKSEQVEKKSEDVKKESDSKIGRDLLAEVDSKETIRSKREILGNDNCETVDAFRESNKSILNEKPGILSEKPEGSSKTAENTLPNKIGKTGNILREKSENILPKNQQNDLPEEVEDVLPKEAENDLPKTEGNDLPQKLETILPKKAEDILPEMPKSVLQKEPNNALPKLSVKIPMKHSDSSKENILPKQIDVLNSLKDNLVNNLKFSQEILETNFINLHKRKK